MTCGARSETFGRKRLASAEMIAFRQKNSTENLNMRLNMRLRFHSETKNDVEEILKKVYPILLAAARARNNDLWHAFFEKAAHKKQLK